MLLTITESSPISQTARRVLATRIITPAQEYEINQALWQRDLSPTDSSLLETLLHGLVSGQIIVLSELGRSQTLSESTSAPDQAFQEIGDFPKVEFCQC